MSAFMSLRDKDPDALGIDIVDDCTLGGDEAEVVKAVSLIESDGKKDGCMVNFPRLSQLHLTPLPLTPWFIWRM